MRVNLTATGSTGRRVTDIQGCMCLLPTAQEEDPPLCEKGDSNCYRQHEKDSHCHAAIKNSACAHTAMKLLYEFNAVTHNAKAAIKE